MTEDREGYIQFLEVSLCRMSSYLRLKDQLERVSAACIQVQAFSERVRDLEMSVCIRWAFSLIN